MGLRFRRVILCVLGGLEATAYAIPTIAFPFNSQVPTVARVDQPYLFQFSSSTFAPVATNFTYVLTGQPAWLTVDSGTRTLSGTPGKGDVGASRFALAAVDEQGVAQMPCTLIVSALPAPQLEGDIGKQLAATTNLSSSAPPVVTVLPSNPFHFTFQQSSFIDIVQRKLDYYATLTDHTPLPSWLLFDAGMLTFSGVAPQLSAFPQSWSVDLIASDVAGFAGAKASFAIAIGTQQLAFVPAQQDVEISSGAELSFIDLKDQLFRNGQPVAVESLASVVTTSLPPWLRFDSTTLTLSGSVPADASDESVTITVTDKLGDTATTVINFVTGNASLFAGTVGSLTAYAGQVFDYHFPDSLFSEPTPILSVILPTTATWLSFDTTSRVLQGIAPTLASPASITATLLARASRGAPGQTQAFSVDVLASAIATSSSIQPAAYPTLTNSSTATPSAVLANDGNRKHLSGGAIAAIIILSIATAALLIACLALYLRRRRRGGYERQTKSPAKSGISRPIPPADPDAITVTTELRRDVERAENNDAHEPAGREASLPPRIALNLSTPPVNNGKSRWLKRASQISQVSSLGNGEDAIKADTNIPEWGADNAALHTPHDSFSVPSEMARLSRTASQSSPTKRALRRLRERHQSRQSVGLGIDVGGGGVGLVPRRGARHTLSHRSAASSAALSVIRDRSSQASLSTRGTSVLSTKPSDFPRPPTRSTLTLSRSIPALYLTEADKRKSIRLVSSSDSVTDSRSMEDKRKSFIRNRASSSIQSPFLSHGPRALLVGRPNARASTVASSVGSLRPSRRGKSTLTSYSESSSLEPQARDCRRLSARVRSVFAPDFPRMVTRSSLGADDEGAGDDGSSAFYTTSSSMSGEDLAAELALPRHARDWVLPAEASPTPPPASLALRQPSSSRHTSLMSEHGRARQGRKEQGRGRASSPLSASVTIPMDRLAPASAQHKGSGVAQGSRLSEPIALVSNDSVSRARIERPWLGHSSSKRPASVTKATGLGGFKTEATAEMDTQAGSEAWEDMESTDFEGGGLMPRPAVGGSQTGTQRSDVSGAAFL